MPAGLAICAKPVCNLQAGGSEYLPVAEIQAGRTYQKAGKIWRIAEAPGCGYEEPIATKLENEFAEL